MTFATITTSRRLRLIVKAEAQSAAKPRSLSLPRRPRANGGMDQSLTRTASLFICVEKHNNHQSRTPRRQSVVGFPVGVELSAACFHQVVTAALSLTAWRHIWPSVFLAGTIRLIYLTATGRVINIRLETINRTSSVKR